MRRLAVDDKPALAFLQARPRRRQLLLVALMLSIGLAALLTYRLRHRQDVEEFLNELKNVVLQRKP